MNLNIKQLANTDGGDKVISDMLKPLFSPGEIKAMVKRLRGDKMTKTELNVLSATAWHKWYAISLVTEDKSNLKEMLKTVKKRKYKPKSEWEEEAAKIADYTWNT